MQPLTADRNTMEFRHERSILLSSCAATLLSTGIALAGPCNTANKDAGSGPTPGHTSQSTTGAAPARSNEHPPTAAMDKAGCAEADAGSTYRCARSARREGEGRQRLLNRYEQTTESHRPPGPSRQAVGELYVAFKRFFRLRCETTLALEDFTWSAKTDLRHHYQ